MITDQFPVLVFEVSFKIADIAGYSDFINFKLDGFDEVISDVHH